MRLTMLDRSTDLELSEQEFVACQHRISALWGLHYPPERWRELLRHLRQVADELGMTLVDCVAALLQEPSPSEVIAQCVRELTVGETYFRRDADFFDKLARDYLTPLIAQRRASQHFQLRLWSAGCCTGEEAYTLAILLGEMLPAQERWHVRILGTDLNPAFLAAARHGCYGNWSFRQAGELWRQRNFVQENNGRWCIREPFRKQVVFLEHNLAEARYPDLALGLADYDVILCRNVLMYFAPAQATVALKRLRDCLGPGGILLLAPAEGILCHRAEIVPDLWPGALCLHRRPSGRSENILPHILQDEVRRAPAENWPMPKRAPEQALSLSEMALTMDAPPAINLRTLTQPSHPGLTVRQQAVLAVEAARAHANGHRLQEAYAWIDHALALNKLDPGIYWLLASLHIEQGEPEKARTALRKSIYLRPDFVMAHYLCGLLNASLGEPAAAERDLDNCLQLLEGLSDDSLLPEAEGLGVKHLKVLVRNSLERCSIE